MEAPIIRTCSLALSVSALLIGIAGPAVASQPDRVQLEAFVRARAADSIGAPDEAVAGYQAALASDPANRIIAERALEQGLAAGDRPLAVKAARSLEQIRATTPEVRFVLLTEAVRTGNWAEAERQVAILSRDDIFSFMAPVLGAWTALGSRGDDPLALLARGDSDPLGGTYAAQHRPLLMLALGQDDEGMAALRARIDAQDSRAQRLMLAGAARLARQGKKGDALALLAGNSPAVVAARASLQKRGKLPGEIATPAQGMAEFFLRVAIDLRRQEVPGLSIAFARLATFLIPDQTEPWLVTSDLLSTQDRNREALAALRNISSSDPAAARVSDLVIRLLAETGEQAAALKQAEKAARARSAKTSDWTRLGDLYSQLQRSREAADAYGRAIDARPDDPPARPVWALWLLKGGALERAGNWPEAKAALTAAYRLAPAEPLVLNYLGYSQLERRENVVEAEQLIREASRLQPDSAQITDSLGWARFIQGDTASAIALLERAARSEPGDPAIHEHLGDAYYQAGRRFEARHAWNAALVSADDEDATRLRAKIDVGLTAELASP